MKKTYAVSDDVFREIVLSSYSIAEIMRKLDLRVEHGPTYPIIRKRIAALGISTEHFDPHKNHRVKRQIPLEQVLVEDISYGSPALRRRLVKAGLLIYQCSKCGNKGEWQGEPLQLQLDHINGKHRDNRLINLRILCPNCHTQTSTHSGKNRLRKPQHHCPKCGKVITKQAKHCQKCCTKAWAHLNLPCHQSKIVWPTAVELKKMVWELSVQGTAKALGVGGTSVIKRCQRWGIITPPNGYWTKRRQGGMSHEEALKSTPKREPKLIELFTLEQLTEIRDLLKQQVSLRKIAARFQTHHSVIASIRDGKTCKTRLRRDLRSLMEDRQSSASTALAS